MLRTLHALRACGRGHSIRVISSSGVQTLTPIRRFSPKDLDPETLARERYSGKPLADSFVVQRPGAERAPIWTPGSVSEPLDRPHQSDVQDAQARFDSEHLTESRRPRRPGLFKIDAPTPEGNVAKQALIHDKSSLLAELAAHIEMRGPLPLSTFMTQAMGHPKHGYYNRENVIGRSGDFVTSPELTQMFGEIIGLWVLTVWLQMDQPSSFRLIELGPGRGTLMNDVLQAAANFPPFLEAIKVHLVETSQPFRMEQYCKLTNSAKGTMDVADPLASSKTLNGVPVSWHYTLKEVPDDGPTVIIAHEFFDALPINKFRYTERGWCEWLVDLNYERLSGKLPHLAKVAGDNALPSSASTAPSTTSAPPSVEGEQSEPSASDAEKDLEKPYSDDDADFRFVLSPQPTPAASLFLGKQSQDPNIQPKIGDEIEINGYGLAVMEEIASRLDKNHGAALVIDYGDDRPFSNSLQGIKDHKPAHVLSDVGHVDLSTHVDFKSLRHVTEAFKNVKAYPLMEQGVFLNEMGLGARKDILAQNVPNQAEKLEECYRRLVDPEQMGSLFKVFCVRHSATQDIGGFSPLDPQDEVPGSPGDAS